MIAGCIFSCFFRLGACGCSGILAIGMFAGSVATSRAAAPDALKRSIETVRAVDGEGKGNLEAANAWKVLAESGDRALLPILEAMNGSNGLAANWLRGAVDTIVERQAGGGAALPVAELGEFLLDTKNDPRGRRLAFELIQEADPGTAERLIPGMLNDPSVELRRGAVQRLVDEAEQLAEKETGKAAAGLVYRQALGGARDVDQIDAIAKGLRELGREVDLRRHFGFLTEWKVIGPWHNTDRAGFSAVFPPEETLDFKAAYNGKIGEVRWQDFASDDEYGMIDLNKPYDTLKEVTAYAYTEFDSESNQPVELRLGSKNAWKIWLNGELLFGRDEYHRGMRIDQYPLKAQMNAGRNTILVKLCQNEQTEDWTVEWQFQLRVCDATGTAIHPVAAQEEPVAINAPEAGER